MNFNISEQTNTQINLSANIQDVNSLNNIENNVEFIKTLIYEKNGLNFYAAYYKIKSSNQYVLTLYYNKKYHNIDIKMLDFLKLREPQDFLNYILNILSKIILVESESISKIFNKY